MKKLKTAAVFAASTITIPFVSNIMAEEGEPILQQPTVIVKEDAKKTELQENVANAEQAVSDAEKASNVAFDELNNAKQELDKATAEYNSATTAEQEAETNVDTYLDNAFEANGKEIAEAKKDNDEVGSMLDDLKKENSELSEEIAKAEEKLSETNDKIQEIYDTISDKDLASTIEEQQKELELLKNSLDTLENQLKATNNEKKDFETNKVSLEKELAPIQEAYNKLSGEKAELEKKMSQLESKLAEVKAAYEIANDEEAFKTLESQLENTSKEIEETQEEIKNVCDSIEEIREEIKNIQEEKAEIEKLSSDLDKQNTEIYDSIGEDQKTIAELEKSKTEKEKEKEATTNYIQQLEQEIKNAQDEYKKLVDENATFEELVKAKKDEVDKLYAAWQNADSVLQQGVLAFYEAELERDDLTENQRYSCEVAINAIKGCLYEDLEEIENPSNTDKLIHTTHLGSASDATSWEQVLKISRESLKELERILKEEEGLNDDLKTTYSVMAVAQIQANASASKFGHSGISKYVTPRTFSENLFYTTGNYKDKEYLVKRLFDGWYYDEKELFESKEYKEYAAECSRLLDEYFKYDWNTKEAEEAYNAYLEYSSSHTFTVGHYVSIKSLAKPNPVAGFASWGDGSSSGSGYKYNYNNVFVNCEGFNEDKCVTDAFSIDEYFDRMESFYNSLKNAENIYNNAKEELEALLSSSPEESIKKLTETIDVNNNLKNNANTLLSALSDEISEIEDLIKQTETSINEKQNSVNALEVSIAEQNKKLEAHNDAISQKELDIQAALQKLASLQNKVDNLEKQQTDLAKLIKTTSEEAASLKTNYDKLTNDITSLKQTMNDKEEEINGVSQDASLLAKSIKEKEDLINSLNEQLENIADKIEEVQKQKSNLENSIKISLNADSMLADLTNKSLSLNSKIKELKNSLQNNEAGQASLETRLAALVKKMKAADEERQRLQTVDSVYTYILRGKHINLEEYDTLTEHEKQLLKEVQDKLDEVVLSYQKMNVSREAFQEKDFLHKESQRVYENATKELKKAQKKLNDYLHPKKNMSVINTENAEEQMDIVDTGIESDVDSYLLGLLGAMGGIYYGIKKRKELE